MNRECQDCQFKELEITQLRSQLAERDARFSKLEGELRDRLDKLIEIQSWPKCVVLLPEN